MDFAQKKTYICWYFTYFFSPVYDYGNLHLGVGNMN